MLRFIIEHHQQDHNQGTDWRDFYTVDCEVPELEQALKRGGFGEMGFEVHRLVSVEIRELPGDERP